MEHVDLALTSVLGHPRVLREAAVSPRRRIVVRGPERLDGVAAWEPLYGRHVEGVVALRDVACRPAATRLLHELLERAAADDIVLVRFVLLPGQADWAAELSEQLEGASVTEDLTIRVA